MTDEKKTTTLEDTVEQAERLEAEALAEEDVGIYTHILKTPLTYEGITYKKLTFNWNSLSGRDSVAIERDLLRRGITTVMAEFTPEYLTAMAARACTYRSEEDFRTVKAETLYALPMRDFRQICGAARRFLMRSESKPETEADGSENNA